MHLRNEPVGVQRSAIATKTLFFCYQIVFYSTWLIFCTRVPIDLPCFSLYIRLSLATPFAVICLVCGCVFRAVYRAVSGAREPLLRALAGCGAAPRALCGILVIDARDDTPNDRGVAPTYERLDACYSQGSILKSPNKQEQ